ncbi:hypothetical protein D3C71_2128430 [compost metagenome]
MPIAGDVAALAEEPVKVTLLKQAKEAQAASDIKGCNAACQLDVQTVLLAFVLLGPGLIAPLQGVDTRVAERS